MRLLSSFGRRDALAITLLTLCPFVYYWQVALGQQVFYANDIFRLFLPLRTELARALGEGRLPLWTPDLQAGFPLLAEGEIAALYPLNLISVLLLSPPASLSFTILFHLAWASVGMYLFARSTGLAPVSALLAGLVFGFSGFILAHLQHAPHLAVGSWLPWLLLCQERYWEARWTGRGAALWFVLASLCIALQWLGGFAQMALLNVGAFTLFGFLSPIIWKPSALAKHTFIHQPFLEAVFITIASIALGVGLAAAQLLPSAELLGFSIRGQEVGRDFFTSHSLEPSALTQFLSPFWRLGEPTIGNMEFWAYVGMLPILLTLLALWLRRDPRTWLFGLLGGLALAFALGDRNPLYQLLYYMPVFNRFRVPARFLFLFTFAAAFLAATGFQELQSRLPSSEIGHIPKRIAAGLAMATVVVVGLTYTLSSDFWSGAWEWLPVVLFLLSAGTILAAKFRCAARVVFVVIVLGLTAFDLTAFSTLFLTLNRMDLPTEVMRAPQSVQAMDTAQPIYRVFANKFPSSCMLTVRTVRAALWPNFSLQYGKQGVTIYAPLALHRNQEYSEDMSPAMWNLMNVRYYLLPLETLNGTERFLFDDSEPSSGLTLDVLAQSPTIPPTRAVHVEITTYTDQSADLPDNSRAGEIELRLDSGAVITAPIRLGIETADWAYDGLALHTRMNHNQPALKRSFRAYLSQVGREFEGHKYIARYPMAPNGEPRTVVAVGARSFLAGGGLVIESVSLIDEAGRSVSLATLLNRNDLALTFRSHTAGMWENKSAMPRAFVVHAAEIVNDDQVLVRMKSQAFRPDRLVLLSEGQPADLLAVADPAGATDEVAITEYGSERVIVRAKTDAAGYLVLTDSWYPGWVALVDGQPAPIHRADYLFRAVPLSPGDHSVVFEYRPASFFWGMVISAISLIVCAAAAMHRILIARLFNQRGVDKGATAA